MAVWTNSVEYSSTDVHCPMLYDLELWNLPIKASDPVIFRVNCELVMDALARFLEGKFLFVVFPSWSIVQYSVAFGHVWFSSCSFILCVSFRCTDQDKTLILPSDHVMCVCVWGFGMNGAVRNGNGNGVTGSVTIVSGWRHTQAGANDWLVPASQPTSKPTKENQPPSSHATRHRSPSSTYTHTLSLFGYTWAHSNRNGTTHPSEHDGVGVIAIHVQDQPADRI